MTRLKPSDPHAAFVAESATFGGQRLKRRWFINKLDGHPSRCGRRRRELVEDARHPGAVNPAGEAVRAEVSGQFRWLRQRADNPIAGNFLLQMCREDFADALADSRATVTAEMEAEYEKMKGELKKRAMDVSPIGFIAPGMLESTRERKHG